MLLPAHRPSKEKGQALLMPAQSGQALLIILLVMAVILTIALSIASRSVTDISVSKQEDDAARAFSAAEAGIEQALNGGTVAISGLSSGGSFSANVVGLAASGKQYVIPLLVSSGEAVPIWFVNHDSSNNNALTCSTNLACSTARQFLLCWGDSTASANPATIPALELSVFYTSSGNNWSTAKIARAAFDPSSSRSNGFTTTGFTAPQVINGTTFPYCQSINLDSTAMFPGTPAIASRGSNAADQTGPQFMRIKLFYNTDKAYPVGINITDSGTLPPQGSNVNSLGQSGDADRRIQVDQLYRDLPPIFDFGLYSGSGGITQ
jgi:Tfp pilus assembly protein PilX